MRSVDREFSVRMVVRAGREKLKAELAKLEEQMAV